MKTNSGAAHRQPHEPVASLASQVRDSLVLNESIIVECVNQVLADMPAHTAEVYRRMLRGSAAFQNAIKRVTVDVGVVLALAKTFESDETFSTSAGLIHEVDFGSHDGKIGQFAKAMVACDLKGVMKAAAGELGEDVALYQMLPPSLLERRLRLLLAFIEHASQAAA